MRFWIRETLGLVLIGLGLFLFWICLALLLSERPAYIQAGPLTLIGIILFRGGIHLLKIAVAARICLHADRDEKAAARRPDAVRAPGPASANDW